MSNVKRDKSPEKIRETLKQQQDQRIDQAQKGHGKASGTVESLFMQAAVQKAAERSQRVGQSIEQQQTPRQPSPVKGREIKQEAKETKVPAKKSEPERLIYTETPQPVEEMPEELTVDMGAWMKIIKDNKFPFNALHGTHQTFGYSEKDVVRSALYSHGIKEDSDRDNAATCFEWLVVLSNESRLNDKNPLSVTGEKYKKALTDTFSNGVKDLCSLAISIVCKEILGKESRTCEDLINGDANTRDKYGATIGFRDYLCALRSALLVNDEGINKKAIAGIRAGLKGLSNEQKAALKEVFTDMFIDREDKSEVRKKVLALFE